MFFTKTLSDKLLIFIALCAGCARLASEEQPKLELSTQKSLEFKDVSATALTGFADYEYQTQKYQSQWLACRQDGARGSVLVQNRDQFGFDPKTFCQGWIAQSALVAGFNVLGVNRPGYGESTGFLDFSGQHSVAAIIAAVNAAQGEHAEFKNIRAVWGASSGAIAAAQYARKVGGINWLLIGNGIFDTEQTLASTQDPFMKGALERIVAIEGKIGHQVRSIAWETQGLPANLIIYHGADNAEVPADRATAFRDAVASAGYKVELSILPSHGHELPSRVHRDILTKVFNRIDAKQ